MWTVKLPREVSGGTERKIWESTVKAIYAINLAGLCPCPKALWNAEGKNKESGGTAG